MRYHDEWLKLEAEDKLDEFYHRHPESEYLFYRAVANGNVEAVRENCENGKFLELDGVGILSKDPVTNLKYHFVVTAAMITRICWQNGMELERTFRLSDFYIQKLDDARTIEDVRRIHDDMVLDFTEKIEIECEQDKQKDKEFLEKLTEEEKDFYQEQTKDIFIFFFFDLSISVNFDQPSPTSCKICIGSRHSVALVRNLIPSLFKTFSTSLSCSPVSLIYLPTLIFCRRENNDFIPLPIVSKICYFYDY